MNTRLDYLIEYRKTRSETPFECYIYWLAMFLIYVYVNHWLAYIMTGLYILGLLGRGIKLNKIDDEIEKELWNRKWNNQIESD